MPKVVTAARQREFLETIWPSPEVKEALALVRQQEEAQADGRALAEIQAEIPKWIEHLAAKQDEMRIPLKGIWLQMWCLAMSGDTTAAKLFVERFDANYKPSTRVQGNYLIGNADWVGKIKQLPDEELRRLAGLLDVSVDTKGEKTDG